MKRTLSCALLAAAAGCQGGATAKSDSLRIAAGVSRFEIGSDWTLRLLTDQGEAIVARRQ